jgi:hypothetical protein
MEIFCVWVGVCVCVCGCVFVCQCALTWRLPQWLEEATLTRSL